MLIHKYDKLINFHLHQVSKILEQKKSMIIDIAMDPEQYFHPKLATGKNEQNIIVSPPLEDLSPLLSRDELAEDMIIPLHEKSKKLK